MTIELIGISGSGKSTLAEHLRARLMERGIEAVDPIEATRRALVNSSGLVLRMILRIVPPVWGRRFVRSRLLWRAKAMRDAREKSAIECGDLFVFVDEMLEKQNVSTGDTQKIKQWFIELATFFWLHRAHLAGEVVVWEEGFALRALTLFQYGADKIEAQDITLYANCIPKPKAVVYLKVSPAIAYERVLKRKKLPNRMKGLSEQEMSEVLSTASKVAYTTCTALKEHNVPVYTIDCDKGLVAVLEQIQKICLNISICV